MRSVNERTVGVKRTMTASHCGTGDDRRVGVVAELVFFGFVVAVIAISFGVILLTDLRKRRTQAETDRQYAADHRAFAQSWARDVDIALAHLAASPLVAGAMRAEWEEFKRRLDSEPESREVCDGIRNARQNAMYLQGIEQGDMQLRVQAVNELREEAHAYGARDAAFLSDQLRANVGSSTFTNEYIQIAALLGPVTQRWMERELRVLRGIDAFSRSAKVEVKPPSLWHRDFVPGAGFGGFIPRYSAWRQCEPHINIGGENSRVNYENEAILFNRFLPSAEDAR